MLPNLKNQAIPLILQFLKPEIKTILVLHKAFSPDDSFYLHRSMFYFQELRNIQNKVSLLFKVILISLNSEALLLKNWNYLGWDDTFLLIRLKNRIWQIISLILLESWTCADSDLSGWYSFWFDKQRLPN